MGMIEVTYFASAFKDMNESSAQTVEVKLVVEELSEVMLTRWWPWWVRWGGGSWRRRPSCS